MNADSEEINEILDEGVLNLYKPVGMTPLGAIEAYKHANPEFTDKPLTYAGRLDPMAEGVLVALYGPMLAHKDEFLHLPKEYIAQIIFGFETDSGDVLGLVTNTKPEVVVLEQQIKGTLASLRGPFTFTLPAYSSYKIGGKALFQWAREARLAEITIPARTVEISALELIETREVHAEQVLSIIESKITTVSGDFRQRESIEGWQQALAPYWDRSFTVATIRVACGSGLYVRTLAQEIAARMSTRAALFHLIRTKIGKYSYHQSLKLPPQEKNKI